MDNSEQVRKSLTSFVTDAVFITVGTAFVYLVAFFYEYGYCDHFGIPSYLISPDVSTVLVAAAAMLIFIFLFLAQGAGFVMPVFVSAKRKSLAGSALGYPLFLNGMLLLLGLLLIRAYGFGISGFLWYLFFLLVINFLWFGLGLIFSEKKSFAEKMKDIERAHDEDPTDIWKYVVEKMGRKGAIIILIPIISFGVSFLAGNGSAAKQDRFLALVSNPDYVVLRIYGDVMVTGKVNIKKKEVGPEYLVVRLDQNQSIGFISKAVGPLILNQDQARAAVETLPRSSKK